MPLRRPVHGEIDMTSGFGVRLDPFLSRPAMHMMRVHLDPNNHNGAVFLGLNGVVVKSHGGANAAGIANALGVAAKLVRDDINRRIAAELDKLRAHRDEATTPLDAA